MDKFRLIRDLYNFLKDNTEGFVSFIGQTFVIHVDGSKYDVMSVSLDENEKITIECVGYSSFMLYYFNINEMRISTIEKIFNNVKRVMA